MELASNGDLIRRQSWPKVEESRIGQDFVTVIRDGASNLLPIPDQMRPWIETLRSLLTKGELPPQAEFEQIGDGKSWRFVQKFDGQQIALLGCGSDLQQIEFRQPDQTRRVLIFQAP